MRVLVLGGGAREHAIIWKLRQSPHVTEVICAPGNHGISQLATAIDVPDQSVDRLVDLAVVQRADLTIASSEEPVHAGVVERFQEKRLRIFGPSKQAARLSWSRHFAKEFLLKHQIPTARYAMFEREELARPYAASRQPPIVIKPESPSGGHGITIAASHEEAYQALRALFSAGSASGRPVIVEEFIAGTEFSLELICDGTRAVAMMPAHCERRLLDDDRGASTPGMGAYAPFAEVSDKMLQTVVSRIADPLIRALADSGSPYRGFLHLSVSIDQGGTPRLLSVSASMGQMESQVLLPLLDEDLFEIAWAVTEGNLAHFHQAGFRFAEGCCLALALTAEGYPGAAHPGAVVTGISDLQNKESVIVERQVLEQAKPITVTARPFVFHEGTAQADKNLTEGDCVTTGSGRVLTLAAHCDNLLDAKVAAYELAKKIEYNGKHCRRDIGDRALG